MNTIQDIVYKIENVYKELNRDYKVFGVFLYGSQNYGLATDNSDVDTKAIIIPTKRDLVLSQPISKTKTFEFGECDIKDIRHMFQMYKKQNVNFIETLFTPYAYIPLPYSNFFERLQERREEIAHFDEYTAMQCFNGLLMQAKKRMLTVTPTTQEDITAYGYHRKSLMNIVKLYGHAEAYVSRKPYNFVLDQHQAYNFRDDIFPLSEAKMIADYYDDGMRRLIAEFRPNPKNSELSEWMDNFLIDVIYSG